MPFERPSPPPERARQPCTFASHVGLESGRLTASQILILMDQRSSVLKRVARALLAPVRICIPILVIGAFGAPGFAQTSIIGAGTGEWNARPPIVEDAPGDATAGTPDLLRAWAASDADYLYLAFEVAEPLVLSDRNQLTLVLDADADATTGHDVLGMGAELVWVFGERSGALYLSEFSGTPRTADLGLIAAPQVTATRFEFALPRRDLPHVAPLLRGDSVRIALRGAPGGDLLPDAPGGALVVLAGTPHERAPVALEKEDPAHLRILSFNVLQDRLFDTRLEEAYRRVLRAIRPDVAVLVEVYHHDGRSAAARVAHLLGEPAASWYGEKAGDDVVVVARSPVTALAGGVELFGNGVFQVDLGDAYATDLVVVGMHPPCCFRDDFRQEEVDAAMAYLRDARGGPELPSGTPFVFAGDMNFVGDARQPRTLLTGDIVDEGRFGPDVAPDWDGSPLTDAHPLATGVPASFTWLNVQDGPAFGPGRLDYVIYSDAVATAARSYVLYTPGLTADELARYGLEAADAAGIEFGDRDSYASDHLPVVVDLVLDPAGGTDADSGARADGPDVTAVAPNPARIRAAVHYRLSAPGPARLEVLDVLGRRVALLASGPHAAGDHSATLDAGALPPGLYVVRLASGGVTRTRTLVVAR